MAETEVLAVLDANVLANIHVCDLFLRLAEEPAMYQPIWSARILDEVQTTHQKLTWKPELSDYWRQEVQRAFADSLVEGFEHYEDQIQVESKDRHVAAVAVQGNASKIVTFNLKDFPPEGIERWNLEAVHPSRFLNSLYEKNPDLVRLRLREFAAKRNCSVPELVDRLREWLPEFISQVEENSGPE